MSLLLWAVGVFSLFYYTTTTAYALDKFNETKFLLSHFTSKGSKWHQMGCMGQVCMHVCVCVRESSPLNTKMHALAIHTAVCGKWLNDDGGGSFCFHRLSFPNNLNFEFFSYCVFIFTSSVENHTVKFVCSKVCWAKKRGDMFSILHVFLLENVIFFWKNLSTKCWQIRRQKENSKQMTKKNGEKIPFLVNIKWVILIVNNKNPVKYNWRIPKEARLINVMKIMNCWCNITWNLIGCLMNFFFLQLDWYSLFTWAD